MWRTDGDGPEKILLGQLRLTQYLHGHIPVFSRNLLANPFNCNCQLAWLGDWLRKRKIVTGNPRCQNPEFLRQIPLQDVAFPDFRCEEGNWRPPRTGPQMGWDRAELWWVAGSTLMCPWVE